MGVTCIQNYVCLASDIAGVKTALAASSTTYAPGSTFYTSDTHLEYFVNGAGVLQQGSGGGIYSFSVNGTVGTATTTATIGWSLGLSKFPASTTLSSASVVGTAVIAVTSSTSIQAGEFILLDANSTTAEIVQVLSGTTTIMTLVAPTLYAHTSTTSAVCSLSVYQPSTTGRVRIRISGTVSSSVTATMTGSLYYAKATTVAAIASGSALTGYTATGAVWTESSVGVQNKTFVLEAYFGTPNVPAAVALPTEGGALTVGAPYIFDASFQSSAGTLQIVNPHITIEEW